MRLDHPRRLALPFAALLASTTLFTAPGLSARPASTRLQEGVRLVGSGDEINGVGSFSRLELLRVSDTGSWAGEIISFTESGNVNVLLRDGQVLTKGGAQAQEPEGAILNTFLDLDLNERGDTVLIARINVTMCQTTRATPRTTG